jgi:ribosomal subunit interface protein
MPLRISGKNVDIGQTLRDHIETRLSDALGKYFSGGFKGTVVVAREGSGYSTDCTLHLDSGTVLHTEGQAHEVYGSADQAVERLAKRLRRYKRKLKSHHGPEAASEAPEASVEAQAYVLATPDDEEDMPDDYSPVVVAETTEQIRTATVGRAVMDLDLSGAPVMVFRNAGSGAINVVYRRADGNIGWIDPSLTQLAS